MIAISYTLTPTIQDYLLDIDKFRRSILITPLPLPTEQKLRWQATNEHIYGSLQLQGSSITKSQINNLLLHPVKHPTAWETDALAYKNALDIVRADWTANPKPLQPSHIGALSLIALPHAARQSMHLLKESEADIKQLLSYAGSQKDHPLMLAGMFYGQLIQTEIGGFTHGILPPLMTTVILAKYGYDCRGMLALEPQWIASMEAHNHAIKSIRTHGNLTAWLEHFIIAAHTSYDLLYTQIRDAANTGLTPSSAQTWNLNSREESILRYLENPAAKATNKVVQHLFRVSQVTASRDLSHLASLGLIFSHGKGRSVYYTGA